MTDDWKCVIGVLYPSQSREYNDSWRSSWQRIGPKCTPKHLALIGQQLSVQYRNAIDFDSFFGVLSSSGDLDKAAESFKKSISGLIHYEVLQGTVPLLKGWLIKR